MKALRVLVIEDDALIAMLLSELLAGMGHDVCATAATEAEAVIDDHPDIALGLNAASKNKEAAKTLLSWVASAEFAELYANALPGFFPLANGEYTLNDPVAQEFVDWRKENKASFRCSYQILSRNANPNNENDLWNACAQILNGTETPKQAAEMVQKNLASWYKP